MTLVCKEQGLLSSLPNGRDFEKRGVTGLSRLVGKFERRRFDKPQCCKIQSGFSE